MSTVKKGKTSGRFAKNLDFRNPQRVLAQTRRSTSVSFCDTLHQTNKRPIYVSFVNKAILWDRGHCNYNGRSVPYHGSLLCSRFLSHMKARPEDFRVPCFLSSKSRPLPPCQEKSHTPAFTAPKHQTLDGYSNLKANSGKCGMLLEGPVAVHSTIIAPYLPPHPTTPLPIINPNSRHPNPGSHLGYEVPVAITCIQRVPTHPAPEEDTVFQEDDAPPPVSTPKPTDSYMKLHHSPVEEHSLSPASLSHGSLSDFSRPPSSLFSRSMDLTSGRSSILSYKTSARSRSLDPEGIICSPPVKSSSVLQTPFASCLPSLPHQSPVNISTTSPISQTLICETKAPPQSPASSIPVCEPKGSRAQEQIIKSPDQEALSEFGHQMTASGQDMVTRTVPITARSSCSPSLLVPIPNSLSSKMTPSPPSSCLGSHWTVLPPISTIQGRCNSAASGSSGVSCVQSDAFEELDAIAPRSSSCLSLDQASDSSQGPSNDTDVSPGLAALTVGCDSGNLGSLSRVRLLLLNRQEPDSSFGFDEDLLLSEDYRDYTDLESNNGVWRPLTAGGISEKCGSKGKVQENKLDDYEGCSGSPSSWIIDPSPSYNMFKSSKSPCNSSNGSTEDEEQSNHPDLREEDEGAFSTTLKHGGRKMEERKTKVLKLLSKLQDDTPHQSTTSKGHSNFEDFDFLAKYCIFNQEKLAEYKRAFEEEDRDGDGYISCLQVLFALKNIIPPELLSEEEEIYVYRILEMVDFKVTDGLVDLRLFAVIASLAQKIANMDEFMRSLISNIDFRTLEVRLFKAKKLFLFLLEEQTSEGAAQQRFISPEQLILELKAGGIYLELEAAIRVELQHIPPLDLLDFLAYLPLFMLIHKSVIANPLDDSSNH